MCLRNKIPARNESHKKPKNEILENAVFTGFQILTDEEIVDDLNGCENEDKEETETEDESQGPSHAEAFEALDIAFKWFERQEESDSLQLLQLKRIRDLAAMKRCDSLRQRSITRCF